MTGKEERNLQVQLLINAKRSTHYYMQFDCLAALECRQASGFPVAERCGLFLPVGMSGEVRTGHAHRAALCRTRAGERLEMTRRKQCPT
jgi:hypothetical protein